MERRPFSLLFLFTVHTWAKLDIDMLSISNPTDHRHGGIRMGVSDDTCDNGRNYLSVDWNIKDRNLYSCTFPVPVEAPRERSFDSRPYCTTVVHDPIHKCLNETITYEETIPLSGPHRPLWPVYGEYLYLPPQRWVHSLEHGAVVFLYHPCADRKEVKILKSIVRRCLRRHIITPYNKLPLSQPFALVTYKCKLTMTKVNTCKVVKFIRETAIKAPERYVWKDGQYSFGLLDHAETIPGSDAADSNLCPDLCPDFR